MGGWILKDDANGKTFALVYDESAIHFTFEDQKMIVEEKEGLFYYQFGPNDKIKVMAAKNMLIISVETRVWNKKDYNIICEYDLLYSKVC